MMLLLVFVLLNFSYTYTQITYTIVQLNIQIRNYMYPKQDIVWPSTWCWYSFFKNMINVHELNKLLSVLRRDMW